MFNSRLHKLDLFEFAPFVVQWYTTQLSPIWRVITHPISAGRMLVILTIGFHIAWPTVKYMPWQKRLSRRENKMKASRKNRIEVVQLKISSWRSLLQIDAV